MGWYEGPLAIAIIGAALTFIAAQYNVWQDRRHDRQKYDEDERKERDTLFVAFYAEVSDIRWKIWVRSEQLRNDLTTGDSPKLREIFAPTRIYESNASNIGRLKDFDLVKGLVGLYSKVHGLNEVSRSINKESNPSEEVILRYSRMLASTLKSAIYMEYWLKHNLKDVPLDAVTFDKSQLDAATNSHLECANDLERIAQARLGASREIAGN